MQKIKTTLMTTLWLLNPIYFGGCDTPTPQEFTFGEADMLELMDEINGQTWTVEKENEAFELEFQLDQQAEEIARLKWMDFIASAHACGDRIFLAEASACLEMSSLPLEGTMRITNLDTEEVVLEDLAVTGEISVQGYHLTSADIALYSDNTHIFFYSPDGEEFSLDIAEW